MHDAAVLASAPRTPAGERLLAIARYAFPFVVVGSIWEIVAHLGVFPIKLFPPLEQVAQAFVTLTLSGVLPLHALETLLRLIAGFGLAALFGVVIGVLMGRSRQAEDIVLPLVSISRRSPASLMRRCSCCGSDRAKSPRCCWSRLFPCSR